MTALAATFSSVAIAPVGSSTATWSARSTQRSPSIASTLSGVGGTTGNPSVQPGSTHLSISAHRLRESVFAVRP